MSDDKAAAYLAEVEGHVMNGRCCDAEAAVPRLLRALRAGLAHHQPVTTANWVKVCSRCSCAESRAVRYPCDEVRDITAALLGETSG